MKKSLALTLFSKLCQCIGPLKLPKTSLPHETERQPDAGGATITSYIMNKLFYTVWKLEGLDSKRGKMQVNFRAYDRPNVRMHAYAKGI